MYSTCTGNDHELFDTVKTTGTAVCSALEFFTFSTLEATLHVMHKKISVGMWQDYVDVYVKSDKYTKSESHTNPNNWG